MNLQIDVLGLRFCWSRAEQVLAWKRGEAVFENVSLVEAITEMNRYSQTPIVLVGDPAVPSDGSAVCTEFAPTPPSRIRARGGVLFGLALNQRRDRLEWVQVRERQMPTGRGGPTSRPAPSTKRQDGTR